MPQTPLTGPVPASWLSPPSPSTSSLQGTAILITGAAGGFGAHLATRCAEAGAYVTIVDIKDTLGSALASQLSSRGLKAQYVHGDVTKWTDQVAAYKSAMRFSPTQAQLNHVVINAAVFDTPFFTGGETLETASLHGPDPPAPPDTVPIDVGLTGALYSLKLAQLYMLSKDNRAEDKDKSILFILSTESYLTLPGSVTYAGAKYGARGLFRSSRQMFAANGVRINALAPWLMETPMNDEGHVKEALKSIGIQFVSLELHSKLALLLLSSENAIAGRCLSVGQPEGVVVDVEDDDGVNEGEGRGYNKILRHLEESGLQFNDLIGKLYGMMGFEV